jgi:hypothetical protein
MCIKKITSKLKIYKNIKYSLTAQYTKLGPAKKFGPQLNSYIL